MKKTSISPAIININTPSQESLSPERKAELLHMLEKYKPAQLFRSGQNVETS